MLPQVLQEDFGILSNHKLPQNLLILHMVKLQNVQ